MSKRDRREKRNRLHREMCDALRRDDVEKVVEIREQFRAMDLAAMERKYSRLNLKTEHRRLPLVPSRMSNEDAVKVDLPRLRERVDPPVR